MTFLNRFAGWLGRNKKTSPISHKTSAPKTQKTGPALDEVLQLYPHVETEELIEISRDNLMRILASAIRDVKRMGGKGIGDELESELMRSHARHIFNDQYRWRKRAELKASTVKKLLADAAKEARNPSRTHRLDIAEILQARKKALRAKAKNK